MKDFEALDNTKVGMAVEFATDEVITTVLVHPLVSGRDIEAWSMQVHFC